MEYNYHDELQRRARAMTDAELRFTARDAQETANLQWSFNPKAGYYRDTATYCEMELARRAGKRRGLWCPRETRFCPFVDISALVAIFAQGDRDAFRARLQNDLQMATR